MPSNLPKWKQNLILVKHGLKRAGKKIVKVYE
ncbi:MAG: hypothetical protein MRERV_25c023 [Mycoplasmataceae bacterium RV_VA103A]|nr:MAG: hypothetical protein MRERV_25c023 [Mycoplasmataceae bacterium RV_VA103A]